MGVCSRGQGVGGIFIHGIFQSFFAIFQSFFAIFGLFFRWLLTGRGLTVLFFGLFLLFFGFLFRCPPLLEIFLRRPCVLLFLL